MKTTAIVYTVTDSSADAGKLPIYLRPINSKPLVAYTLEVLQKSSVIDEIILTVDADYFLYCSENIVNRYELSKVRKIRNAADSRFKSVYTGLEGVEPETNIVFIHDALCPFISDTILHTMVDKCVSEKAVALGQVCPVSVKRAEQGFILASLDKNRIFLIQSPQAFSYQLIMDAYHNAPADGQEFNDDAALVEYLGHKVRVVTGPPENFRVSSEYEFKLARYLLEQNFRTGANHD